MLGCHIKLLMDITSSGHKMYTNIVVSMWQAIQHLPPSAFLRIVQTPAAWFTTSSSDVHHEDVSDHVMAMVQGKMSVLENHRLEFDNARRLHNRVELVSASPRLALPYQHICPVHSMWFQGGQP